MCLDKLGKVRLIFVNTFFCKQKELLLHSRILLWAHYMLKTIKIIWHIYYKLITCNNILQAKQTDKQTEPQRDRNERKRELKESKISQREREKYFKESITKIKLIKIIQPN